MKTPPHLMICAESGVQVGTGHVMRCLSLGQAWKRGGGAVTFVVREGLGGIEERIRAEGLSVEALPSVTGSSTGAFVQAVLHRNSSHAVLDGYNFSGGQQAMLTNAGVQVLTLDDYGHASEYPVRWILNQNAYATADMYARKNPDTQLLLGTAYALLREEFSSWLGWTRSISNHAHKVLITVGGSDPSNASEKILRSLALLKTSDLEVILVVGAGNPHLAVLQAAVRSSPVPVEIAQNVQDMPALMAWADVGIAGAGITSYELCYMGLPSLLLVVAENQRRIAECLGKTELAVNAGAAQDFRGEAFAEQLRSLIESPHHREKLSRAARKLVDGQGSQRVRAALLDRELILRPVRIDDRELLFDLAIDPSARAASFYSEPISWENHVAWFAERLQDNESVIYIGENTRREVVGLVRFQLKRKCAVLSINVAPKFRGKGWGRELVLFSTSALFRDYSVSTIKAYVKPNNHPSVRLFEASGFRHAETDRVSNQDALLFVRECAGTDVQRVHVQ